MTRQRLIVIGLDGATFDVIEPMIENTDLPHIRDLIKGGTSARLMSTIPYATMPAWPSFMTGKNPGKHGVFDFFNYTDGQRRISNSQDIRAFTLWEILSDHNKRSIVVNVPGTFPPRAINGIIVSGMLTPSGTTFVSPPEAEALLNDVSGEYRINSRGDFSDTDLIEDIYAVTEKQRRGFLALLEREHWDFAMMMFRATDEIQHHFWEKHGIVRECYQRFDATIGEIRTAFPEAAVFLISDHGLQGQYQDFHVNKWLIDQGYMRVKESSDLEASRWEEIGKLDGHTEQARSRLGRSDALQFLSRVGITKRKLSSFIPDSAWKTLKRLVPRSVSDLIPVKDTPDHEVDWEHTRASAYQLYSMESKAVKIINVDPALRGKVCVEIIEKLENLQEPQTGEPVVRRAYRREELYTGPYIDQAPDIILDLHDGYNITNTFFAEDFVTSREHIRGCHHREGIFIAHGPSIRNGKILDPSPSLIDVMPTILHYLDVPIPNDCDGEVLKHIFDIDSATYRRSLDYEEKNWKEESTDESLAYSEDEQSQIEERLRGLGYL